MTFISLQDEELIKAVQMDLIQNMNDFIIANFKGEKAYIDMQNHIDDLLDQVYDDEPVQSPPKIQLDLNLKHPCVCDSRDVYAFGCKCGGT